MNIIDVTRTPFPEFDDEGNFVGNRELCAVLTADVNNMKAVYVGFAERGNEEYIARSGSKQTYKNSLRFFPSLTRKEYRR